MANLSAELENSLVSLEPAVRRQRQSALLTHMNTILSTISVLGLLFMVIPPWSSKPLDFAIVIGSLLLNIIVAILRRADKVQIASIVFILTVNIGIIIILGNNLKSRETFSSSMLFACQLALVIMLAGMFLSMNYAFFFTGTNILVLSILYFWYYSRVDNVSDINTFGAILKVVVPVSSFLIIIAVISWLYERAMLKADQQLERARKQIIQNELLRRDMAIARDLQLRLLPAAPTPSAALQIATRTEPARETSGDFYDFIELADDHLAIVVADVTGKSVAAALMMALARVTIRSEARRHAAPSEVLRAANDTISRDHTARQLITAFYGLLDTKTMLLRFANAGHPYPILRRGEQLHEIELGGLPLGGRPDTHYSEQTVQLLPGDQLFVLSDGLIEERNPGREIFGYERLGPAILATDPSDPAQALETLWQTVACFRGDCEQADDITLVVVQALPARAAL